MEQKISEIKKSLKKAVEDLYSVDENISEWDEKCDVEEAIRSISNAIRRLNSFGLVFLRLSKESVDGDLQHKYSFPTLSMLVPCVGSKCS